MIAMWQQRRFFVTLERTFITAVIATTAGTGVVGMDPATAEALGELRRFNYERIYTRPESVAQSHTVVRVLTDLVEYYLGAPAALPVNPSVCKPAS